MDRKNPGVFLKEYFGNFFVAITNLFIFFPYFFSVGPLLKTLFAPWKNLTSQKEVVGFSLNDYLNRLSFNLISRGIGFFLRSSMIIFYLFLQVTFIILIPFILFISALLLPLIFFFNQFEKSEEEKKNLLRESFTKAHLTDGKNIEAVQAWFEKYYRLYHTKTHWWQLESLMSQTPLGRDWAAGYTPTLDQFTEEITTGAYQSRMTSVMDREREITQIETVMSKNREANVIIVGDEGVGKHTIVDAFAKKVYEGKINPLLIYKRILKLNLEKILNQSTDQKQRESVLDELFKEAAAAGNIILMIENFDRYVFSGTDRVNLTSPIEKYGKTENLHFIAITTPFAYQKYIFPNEAIVRIFTKIDVFEIERPAAQEILLEKALVFEARNQVIIPFETVANVIEKSDFFVTNIPFPEKAIELLDKACAYVNQSNQSKKTALIVSPEVIDNILTQETHIPTKLNEELKSKLVDLEKMLGEYVLFQEEALTQLSASLRRSFLLLGKRKKPLATFLFLGPTGVGKTETARALARTFFGSDEHILRFDMSLYQSRDDIVKLVGSMETQNPGLLTKTIRDNPFGVLLLDEIEKANPDLLNIFLTILDEGYFTDGFGKRVDCKNLMIIATSNAGSDFIFKLIKEQGATVDQKKNDLLNYLVVNKLFSPEFLNRFDGVIAYKPLDSTKALELGKRIINRLIETYGTLHGVTVKVSPQTLEAVVQKGFHPEFGARDLERVVTQELEDKVAKLVLSNKAASGSEVTL